MSRLGSAALGAGITTAIIKPEVFTDLAKDAALAGLMSRSSKSGGSSSEEIQQLYQLVEQLSRDVHTKQPVTIVQTGSDRASSLVLYTTAGVLGGTFLYFKFIRGWTVGDFMYVTRRSLRQGIAQVTGGLEALSGKVAEIREKLQARIAELSRKQDATIAAQAQLKQQLGRVGDDVEVTRGQVGQIHGLVLDMEATMSEVGANQRHANHGIYILCKAVSELMQGSNIPSKAELIEYTQQHPVWAGDRLQGLEGVLRGRDENAAGVGSSARGPFLLRDGAGSTHTATPCYSGRDSPVKGYSAGASPVKGGGSSEGGQVASAQGSPFRSSGGVAVPQVSYPVHVGGGLLGLRSSTVSDAGW